MRNSTFFAGILTLALSAGAVQAKQYCPGRSCEAPGHNKEVVSVPEPASLALLATSLAALGVSRLRRQKSKKNHDK